MYFLGDILTISDPQQCSINLNCPEFVYSYKEIILIYRSCSANIAELLGYRLQEGLVPKGKGVRATDTPVQLVFFSFWLYQLVYLFYHSDRGKNCNCLVKFMDATNKLIVIWFDFIYEVWRINDIFMMKIKYTLRLRIVEGS